MSGLGTAVLSINMMCREQRKGRKLTTAAPLKLYSPHSATPQLRVMIYDHLGVSRARNGCFSDIVRLLRLNWFGDDGSLGFSCCLL